MVSKVRHSITHHLHIAEEWIFANPKVVLAFILVGTLLFGLALPKLRVFTDFSDLLPQNHAYIQTYNRIKENFGGANMIVMAIEVEQGAEGRLAQVLLDRLRAAQEVGLSLPLPQDARLLRLCRYGQRERQCGLAGGGRAGDGQPAGPVVWGRSGGADHVGWRFGRVGDQVGSGRIRSDQPTRLSGARASP